MKFELLDRIPPDLEIHVPLELKDVTVDDSADGDSVISEGK